MLEVEGGGEGRREGGRERGIVHKNMALVRQNKRRNYAAWPRELSLMFQPFLLLLLLLLPMIMLLFLISH